MEKPFNPYLPPIGIVYKTIPQAAEIFQTNVTTIYRWIKGNVLQSKKIGGKRYILFDNTPAEQLTQSANYEDIIRHTEGGPQ